VLLLETTGRKTGLPRITPLQYDKIEGIVYVGSARGVKADWFQNLVANPNVRLTVGSRQFQGYAEPITTPSQIADFLELRLQLHPKLIGAVLRFEGLGSTPSREELLQYAANRALVAIYPTKEP
jgi:deazaflavin-dependent oxidoreductase (nitroreductase family)